MMHYLKIGLLLTLTTGFMSRAQPIKDSTRPKPSFSGTLGMTNNGFSIIPSFSFNAPGALAQLSWKWNRCSIEPDIRLTPNAKKGSILLWWRWQAIKRNRFSFRIGAHPAMNWIPAEITENGSKTEVIRMRRFLAWELAPTLKMSKRWNMGLYYLQGNGLQANGPQTTHFINLNSVISNIKISETTRFTIAPAIYYLYLDGHSGVFLTGTATLSHLKLPFTLHSSFNKTISANIPGNRNFMWNIGASYHFRKELR